MQQYSWYRYAGVAGSISIIALWLVGCGTLVTPAPSLQATASTAVVHPYPTPSGTQMLYSNALTTPAAGWASGPECRFTSNGLVVRPNGGQAYICLAPTAALADVSVAVTVQQTNGPLTHAYGIAFRHAAPKNYYFFGIDGKGCYTLTIVVNDISHTVIPFTANAAIHSGANAVNRLQVIARGNVITFLVNGSAVGQATLTTYASGTIGLRGINNGSVTFQQLSIAKV
ncbi:MAG TPA: hypothetical protein VFQ36_24880 [Ktedonobacteraceae bacterium]|nr:hypothetical protein [Ktedonobacteraceae bacterium]